MTLRRLTVCLLIVVSHAAVAQTENLGERLAAYSASFAKRFALPEPQIPLPDGDGLHAIELISARTISQSPWCEAKLYIDSALPIAFPSADQAGSQEVTNGNQHFFLARDAGAKRWQRYSETDRRHFRARQMSVYQLAAIATPDYSPPNQGSLFGAPYRAFMREMFPGITYIHLGVPCRWFSDFGTRYPAAQILLMRSGGPDYKDPKYGGQLQPEHFVKFDVPIELLHKMKVAIASK